jgi:hypothetical protein
MDMQQNSDSVNLAFRVLNPVAIVFPHAHHEARHISPTLANKDTE